LLDPGVALDAPASPVPGGESAGRRRLEEWLGGGLVADDRLDADGGSRLSPYLHLGCVSAREVAARVASLEGGEEFLRRLCWRDFFLQLLAANPRLPQDDLHARGDAWTDDPDALARWREGTTGYPLVDAGMRQLASEARLPNRARLVVASFLTKTLYLDWRLGAAVFSELLVDADLANNVGNWQWAAGTGTDTRPNRVLDPVAQGKKLDPEGTYVRRWVPELEHLAGAAVHEPWKGRAPAYPEPIVDSAAAHARFRALRTSK
jgi:deoxyribodipyrimidine photo-lyase